MHGFCAYASFIHLAHLVWCQRIKHPSMNVAPVSLDRGKKVKKIQEIIYEKEGPNSMNLSSLRIWYIFIPSLVLDV